MTPVVRIKLGERERTQVSVLGGTSAAPTLSQPFTGDIIELSPASLSCIHKPVLVTRGICTLYVWPQSPSKF